MKLFPRFFFLSLLVITLFQTGSAMAIISPISSVVKITVTTTSDCTDSGVCSVNLLCPSTANTLIGYKINEENLVNCSSSNLDLQPSCKSDCITVKTTLMSAAAYKAKLDPMAEASYNIGDNSFSRAMCQALKVVNGSAGKTFAAFAIIATGIGFFTGKVSWGLMIGVTAGIATMFGAPSIVAAISGQDTNMNCKTIMPY